ncbi:hypothetical protein [Parafrankia discariae]|uniref:hypothetical protein n=1 Tax=Parafrankia discariae TaxID=365528 RepID=UPI000371BA01|nr:hypothetical protein [Parafrankia discariae]
MRQAFAHDAVIDMSPDADVAAPGAAVTVALCGHWEHQPPCPLATHHTHATRTGPRGVRLRILFATEPEQEHTVRRRIEAALATGRLLGPDGPTRWQLRASQRGDLAAAESAHAERLTRD